MMTKRMVFAGLLALSGTVLAQQSTDQTKEEMQRALNQQVMNSPFNAGDVKKAEAYADDALKKGIEPVPTPPQYWQPGWTCGNLTGYAYYNYYDYQNCIYYHRYYHRYW